ncbi:hypothetical protein BgiBS90_009578, partial [Biomphalaria glabrata]
HDGRVMFRSSSLTTYCEAMLGLVFSTSPDIKRLQYDVKAGNTSSDYLGRQG